MLQTVWAGENRKMTVCIDSYEAGLMKGRILNTNQEIAYFENLIQFLFVIGEFLEEQQVPQSYTLLRKFSDFIPRGEGSNVFSQNRKGTKATFELRVLFRQHTSWQGVITWREGKKEQSFRSVLELMILMDSALRNPQEGVD